MRKPLLVTFFLSLILIGGIKAQEPIIDSWIVNNSGKIAKYYNSTGSLVSTGEIADVGQICYSADSVWITSTGMPSVFGPWLNPGSATNQHFVYRIPRNPQQAASPVTVPVVFALGTLINGAPMFTNGDATSYKSSTNSNVSNGDGNWNASAYYNEGVSLDTTFAGHVNQDGTYHSHATPFKLYNKFPSTQHSPIVGFAFDGFPVYGPFAYTDPNDNTSAIKRMKSSYQLRSITTRTILPDGSTSNPAGPNVSASFPLGKYIEDYEYIAALGDLDEHNGRYCITPEYPSGTYAYFVTTENDGTPAHPYYVGTTFYGTPETANMQGPNTHISIPASGTSCSALAVKAPEESQFLILPNPVQGIMKIEMNGALDIADYEITISNALGKALIKNKGTETIDLSSLNPGMYMLTLYNATSGTTELQKFIKQ